METSSSYQKLLVEGIKEVEERAFIEEYERFNARKELYREVSSDKAFEEFYSVSSLGDIPKFNGKLEALTRSPGYLYRIEPCEFAAKEQWERKFVDDNQYDVINDDAEELARSMARTINKYCAYPFWYATSTQNEFMTTEEGVSLASSSHTNKTGASTTTGFSNIVTTALSPTALASARLLGNNIKNDKGQRIGHNFDTLLVPRALEQKAWEITQTATGLYSGEGTKNFYQNKFKVMVWDLLDDNDTNNWALIDSTQMKKDLLFIPRVEPEFEANHDFETKVTSSSVYSRFGLGYKGWRWIIFASVS
jgi:hypothetical protein